MLAGYTAYNKEGEIIEGSMLPKRLTQSLSPGGSVTIPSGWYDGTNSKVAAQGLSVATNGVTAKKENILSGYTGWRDGSQLTGTMSNRGATNSTLSANGTYTVPDGWHSGGGKVTQSLSTQGAKTVTPSTANQTIVAASKWVTGNQIVAGNANLVAGNIKKGVSIFGVTGNYTDPNRTDRVYLSGYNYKTGSNGGANVWYTHAYYLNLPEPIDQSVYKYVWISGVNWHTCTADNNSVANTNRQCAQLVFLNRKYTNVGFSKSEVLSSTARYTYTFSDTIVVTETEWVSGPSDGGISVIRPLVKDVTYSGTDTAYIEIPGYGTWCSRPATFPITALDDKAVTVTIQNDGTVIGTWDKRNDNGNIIRLFGRNDMYKFTRGSRNNILVLDTSTEDSLIQRYQAKVNYHTSPDHYTLPSDHSWWEYIANTSGTVVLPGGSGTVTTPDNRITIGNYIYDTHPLDLSTRVEYVSELWSHNDDYTSFQHNTGKIYHILAFFSGASWVKDVSIWFSKTCDVLGNKL